VGWYRRSIQRPDEWSNAQTILHFGAVHYYCQVWLNGQYIGEHTGGYLPFSFDITHALTAGQGELIVRVEAPVDKRFIPHGKQLSEPRDDYYECCFTPSSGIWQPVWLENRPATYIESVYLSPTEDLAGIRVEVTLAGPHLEDAQLQIQLADEPGQSFTVGELATFQWTLPLHEPQLWSPANPHLYRVVTQLKSVDGEDRVGSYTGLRKIEIRGKHLLLNGERLFVRGVLDQGYWPDSGYTAPSDEDLRRDVEMTLAAGYNLDRKHIKFEDPRWLYWADRLGLLVWEEPPCFGRYTPEAAALFETQLAPMVARDSNHPCIIFWGIYNEEWGLDFRSAQDKDKQEAVIRAYDTLAGLDKSRPIIDDSGWSHVKTDILDWHYYDDDIKRWNGVTRALATDLTTWFGHQIAVDTWYETQLSVAGRDHSDLPLINGEYGGGRTARERSWHLRWQTQAFFRHDAISGYIYTEIFDVEHELCGIYTADRQEKDLGFDPAIINAETIVIFDLVPIAPGLDYQTTDGNINCSLFLAHKGTRTLEGQLYWGWTENTPLASTSVTLAGFENSPPVAIQCQLPDTTSARLHVWCNDQSGQRRAYGFLDISLAANIP
jgi:beta-galactosidase/beta-glucuronidase